MAAIGDRRGRRSRGTVTSTWCRRDPVDTWSQPPLAGEVVDGRLIGRGACDMKGPIAAALAAAAAMRRAGDRGSAAGSRSTWPPTRSWRDPRHEGAVGARAARPGRRIVGEPSELAVGLAERGGAWITVTAHGTAAHGSQPELGVNAITSMARFLLRLRRGAARPRASAVRPARPSTRR